MADEDFHRRVERAVVRTLDRAGGEVVVPFIKGRISTPYPPSSTRGNPPHRRTGKLLSGVTHSTRATQNGAVTTISSSRPGGNPRVPSILESPGLLNRPYMVPAMMHFRVNLIPYFVRIFKEEMGR